MKNDVTIIGGGITGLSAAYFLLKKGVNNIRVFEANYIGYGSSGRCAGGIRASFTSRVHVNLMREAIKLEIPNKVDYESGPNWGNIKPE